MLRLLVCALFLLGGCHGRFVVEKNSLNVTAPEDLKGTCECAIGNFGVPQYGGTMVGFVAYPKPTGRRARTSTISTSRTRPSPGRFLLVDRGACYSPSRTVCDHGSVMKEIAKEQSLVTQLRAIVLPALQADKRSELVAQMFQDVLDCSSKAMAELQLLRDKSDDDALLLDDKKRVRRINPNGLDKEDVIKPRQKHNSRSRRFADSVPLETPIPHYDGHQWRKYGQKEINKEKHPRSYYRCTYKQEQGCKATKTVQQQDEGTGADHAAVMYTVVYHGQHTCKQGNSCSDSGADGFEAKIAVPSGSDDSRSSISKNCLECPCDQQSSRDGSNKLINESADLNAENNMYEAFDMTASAFLELDSWDLDALLRSDA